MSTVVIDSSNTVVAEQSATLAVSSPVVRTPFYWTSQQEPLFGWLHTLRNELQFEHGVVIAAPTGYEQLHAHRGLRCLADALAERGIPTMRFDWHGTGDSAGRDEDPQRLAVWRANLRDAIAFLKQQIKVKQVSVVGLRLGATLAATTLSDTEVAQLVLWAPVVSGRTYVREMTAIDRTSEIPVVPVSGQPHDLEPAGLVFTEETAQSLSPLNLLQSPPVLCRTLLVGRDDLPLDPKLSAWYSAAGVPVTQIAGSGYAGLMTDPHKGCVPTRTIRDIADWLTQGLASSHSRKHMLPEFQYRLPELITRQQTEGPGNVLPGSRIRERAWKLATEPEVFAIISEPDVPVDPKKPTIVVLNAGTAYRVGPGRLNTHLTRRLAAEGYRCVRIDANGIGDSVAQPGDPDNQTYTATIFRDVDRTLSSLREQHLGERFVLVGLCSGAYFAFQSAAAFSDPGLIESILINPLAYFWQDGMQITESSDHQIKVQNYYFESAIDPRKWLKLFSGQTKIGIGGAARLAADRFRRILSSSQQELRASSDRDPYAHPPEDNLTADLDRITAIQRHVTMFFGESEPGYAILMAKAGQQAKQLQRSEQLEIHFIKNTDHNFSRRSARHDLLNGLVTHLRERYS